MGLGETSAQRRQIQPRDGGRSVLAARAREITRRPAFRRGAGRGHGNRQRVVRVPYADIRHTFQRDVFGSDIRSQQFPPAGFRQPAVAETQRGDQISVQQLLHRFLAIRSQRRQAQAEGREHAGKGMQQHGIHAQFLGDRAGVLAARAAERTKGKIRRVLASLDRDLLDRRRHLVDRYAQKALGNFLNAHAPAAILQQIVGKPLQSGTGCLRVQRLASVRPEHAGKHARLKAPQREVGVGNRYRPAVAVAGRPRVGARRFRPGKKAPRLVPQDGPSPRCHRVNLEHGRPQPGAGDFVVGHIFVAAGIQRNIGGRAAHVKTDQLLEARLTGGSHRAHHAGRGPGKDGVLAPELRCLHQPAVALHESEVARRDPRFLQPLPEAADVAAQDRRKVRVGQRGVAAAHQLDERRDFMRK